MPGAVLVLVVDVHFVAVAVSFAQAYLRLRSESLWPPIFLHASHNLWTQSIFKPLTTDKDYTKWVAGDLGLAKRRYVAAPVDNSSAPAR